MVFASRRERRNVHWLETRLVAHERSTRARVEDLRAEGGRAAWRVRT